MPWLDPGPGSFLASRFEIRTRCEKARRTNPDSSLPLADSTVAGTTAGVADSVEIALPARMDFVSPMITCWKFLPYRTS